jgi:CheY-like chemotaxis protein
MKKKRILIVDDEASFTRLVSLNLSYQYYVRVENSPTEARQAALEFKPDLILLDVMMPQMDGGDLASALRADPALQNVPIVFLTAAVAKQEVSSHGGTIGGFPFLAKPASVQEIRDCIEKNLKT